MTKVCCKQCGHERFFVAHIEESHEAADLACCLCGKEFRVTEEWLEDCNAGLFGDQVEIVKRGDVHAA